MRGEMVSLRGWRRRRLLKQTELAARSGVSVATISAVEGGKHRRQEIETIRRLASALGVTPARVDELRAAMEAPEG